ncbi:TraB/GumN family protein [Candidatus Woesearchaeota archaeon]|nr:TraB/GumN family protein [Candidatus Woesearchaeota archaeon]MBW3022378.1 TraB/GumN family protein [Candidatus Woesearchaeota archaeon]
MLRYNNLTIIGTSHISIESVNTIKKEINDNKPDIICLELDKNRFYGLFQKKRKGPSLRDIKDIGVKGWLFLIIGGYVEKKLGKKVGLEPGAEMKEAIKQAQLHNIAIALVDQDIRITLKKLSKAFSAKEKWNLFKDILKGLFMRKKEIKRLGIDKLDLTKVPEQELIDRLMVEVKEKYPNFYKVLVSDRNKVMARKISALMQTNPEKKLLAVVGAGHEKEMLELIKNQ